MKSGGSWRYPHTVPPRPSTPTLLSGLAVGLLAGVLALWGLDARDLSGDEQHMLRGSLWRIAELSLDPRLPFTGHQPLSFWLRELVLGVAGEPRIWAWRLHSGVAHVGTALLGWHLFQSRARPGAALLAGGLLALHPILLFHAHDAGNYALSALLALAMLRGLADLVEGRRGGGLWLGGALALGALNDVYLGLVGLVAVVLSLPLWRAPARRVELRRAWLLGAGIALPLVGLLAARLVLGGEEGAVALHADPVGSTALPALVDVPLRLLARFGGAAVWGYPAGRTLGPWEIGPPLALLGVAAAAMLARGRAVLPRLAASLMLGGLGLFCVGGLVFRLGLDRGLPTEPRALIGLFPLAVVVLVGAVDRAGPRLGTVLGALLGVHTVAVALPLLWTPGDLRSQASEVVQAGLQAGDAVVGDGPFGWRLQRAGVSAEVKECLDEAPLGRVWWLATHVLDGPGPWCGEAPPGWEVQETTVWSPSAQERNAASFQPVRVLALMAPRARGTYPAQVPVRFTAAPLSGVSGSWLEVRADYADAVIFAGPAEDARIDLPPEGLGPLRARLLRPDRSAFPASGLLDPYRREVQAWEAQEPGLNGWVLPLEPLRAPAWQVLDRLVICGLAGVLGLVSLLGGRRLRWPGALRQPAVSWLARRSSPSPSPSERPAWAPPAAWTRHPAAVGSGLGALLLVAVLVVSRVLSHPVEAYGDSAAGWIEHLALLRAQEDWLGASGGPLARFLAADDLYPPLLHLLTAPISVLADHAPSAAVLTMLGWLGLLALAGAWWARGVGGGGAWIALGVVLTPALHAVATRYYYDLPMTALLWVGGLAVWQAAAPGLSRRRGVGLALVGGLFLAAAALVKWSALPLGVLIVGVLALSRGRRGLLPLALALLVFFVLSGAFLGAGSTSFGAMGGATFQLPTGASVPSWIVALSEVPGGRLPATAALQLLTMDAARLGFYPARLVTTVFGPVLSMGVALGLWGWWSQGRPGWIWVGGSLVGQGLFVLLLVPPLDERFLLPQVPALVLPAAWGLVRMPVWAGGAVLVMALGTALDLHLGAPRAESVRSADPARLGHRWAPRLGVSSSFDRRGWSRADDRRPTRDGLRESVFEAVSACAVTRVGGPDATLDPAGDLNWWSALAAASRARDGWASPRSQELRWITVDGRVPPSESPSLRLFPEGPVSIEMEAARPPAARWVRLAVVDDPEGGPGVGIYGRLGDTPCP